MKFHAISIPTPFPVGDVNVYLVDDEPLTLIDTGPKTAEALARLENGLREYKFGLADIKRILLTHAHEDHCGLVKTIRDASPDCELWIHSWEDGFLFGDEAGTHEDLLRRAGVLEEIIVENRQFYDLFRKTGDVVARESFNFYRDEMQIEFARGSLQVLHTPGHTPGSCSFLRESDRTLIAGDCLLKRITPNPVLAFDPVDKSRRFPAIAEYLVSLARIRNLAPTLVLGGHGEPITDYEELFNRYLRAHNSRQEKTFGLLTADGVTAWEMAGLLFPDFIDDRVHRFLAICEAVAHLDYLVSENKISVEVSDGVEFYRKG